MIEVEHLKKEKNLLAFSAGVDSSALFFLLLEHKINFDIAFVNYQTRKESNKEEAHAKNLAKQYHLNCYTIKAPSFKNNFEKNARDFRYHFFESLIQTHHYTTLLTAHQLNDQLEWFLMRLTKGSGLSELIGLQTLTQKTNYQLIRPLLHCSKEALIDYLQKHHFPYFIDESNQSDKYERNRFRKAFSNQLIENYSKGIQRSFEYLQKDKKRLESDFSTLFKEKALTILKLNPLASKSKAVDITLKRLGYLLSSSQREEIEKKRSIVIGGIWAIESSKNFIYIAPYLKTAMPKEFKELSRIAKIPQKIRPYCFIEKIDYKQFSHLIQTYP